MALVLLNKDQVQKQLDAWCAKAEKVATDVARGLVVKAFNNVIEKGPQFNGDFVANIRLGVNVVDTTFEPYVVGRSLPVGKQGMTTPFHEGSPEAMRYARFNASQALSKFKLGDTVWISSSAVHDEPYSFKIENNTIKFRDVNPSKGMTFSRAVAMVAATYSNLTPAQIKSLMSARWYA